ncbi:MAG TPA: cobalt-precorrin-6A/precorrin-6x reductase, partial [Fusobacteriaceae bacterium]|nr:cobalt-precorrin-6A/precorrin-6x reductase [Fusobacteriaceae bacterium]
MILLAGGTKDSRIIADKLLKNNHKVVVTTATEYGG